MAASETSPRTRTPTEPAPRVRYSPRRWLREIGWRHLVLILAVLFALFPVAWVVSSAFNSVDTLATSRLIPPRVTLDNFTELFTNPLAPFARWIFNTWRIALIAASLNLMTAAFAAYAFSRLRFRGRRVGLLTLLLVQVFPQFLGFIALFLLAQQIGEVIPGAGLNTHAFLIMVYLGGAMGFNAFLIKGFMDTIPASLDESARVDGATPAQVFWRIVFPLSRPVLAVIFIITFVYIYSEYILARTLLRSTENFTLALGLQLFVQDGYTARWGPMTAAALLGALPIVITFLIAQRHIIGGLTQGAVKD